MRTRVKVERGLSRGGWELQRLGIISMGGEENELAICKRKRKEHFGRKTLGAFCHFRGLDIKNRRIGYLPLRFGILLEGVRYFHCSSARRSDSHWSSPGRFRGLPGSFADVSVIHSASIVSYQLFHLPLSYFPVHALVAFGVGMQRITME